VIHNRCQEQDAAADAMAKEMADATSRVLVDGQRQRNWRYRSPGGYAAATHLSLIAAKAINASSRQLRGTGYAAEMADASRRAFVNKQRRHMSAGQRDWRYQGPRAATTIKTETKHSTTVWMTMTRTTALTSSGGT
jgi:hypothetical protein